MADDWRIRIEVEEEEHAGGLLERLRGELGGEARQLAEELRERRLAVSRDGSEVFVYAPARDAAEKALPVIEATLRELGIEATTSSIDHWLEDEERWDDEAPDETWEEEELEHGHAPWEVRVEPGSRDEARRLATELRSEGYGVERSFDRLIVGARSRDDAEQLAQRLHGEVEAGGAVVWETVPGNPFAVFGGLGGSGTPIG
jgi:hypothetical protein